MGSCEVCHNPSDATFEIVLKNGRRHVFDTFECAIHSLARLCDHCGCRILGHFIEENDKAYCCSGCAEKKQVLE